jgi:hypothetical protein
MWSKQTLNRVEHYAANDLVNRRILKGRERHGLGLNHHGVIKNAFI